MTRDKRMRVGSYLMGLGIGILIGLSAGVKAALAGLELVIFISLFGLIALIIGVWIMTAGEAQ